MKIQCRCSWCDQSYERSKGADNRAKRFGWASFCSPTCVSAGQSTAIFVECTQCNTKFKKVPSAIKKTKNHFCCQSCAAIYNNTHKTTGYRRSKLEIWIETELVRLYPNLPMVFNGETINSELDIYFPVLKLGVELNGVFHYEPIYGQEKLLQIANNDNRKFQACIERGIELCIIDTSQFTHFKLSKAHRYLKIITDILDTKMMQASRS